MPNTSFQYPLASYNARSAAVVLPLILTHVQVESLLDVGCGIGTWMKVALELGVQEVVGVDGSDSSKAHLIVARQHYQQMDLTAPLQLHRRFDLAICLEVGEHLPATKADVLVQSLVAHADLILFSAAIPGQEGEGHVNEQWATYWQQKFIAHGYYFSDVLRPLLWSNPEVDVWYKQNCVLVVKHGTAAARQFPETTHFQDIVHPELYAYVLKQAQRMTLFENGKGSLQLLVKYFWKTLLNKLR